MAGVPWLPEDCEEQEDNVTEWTGLEFLDSQRTVKNRKTTSQSGHGWSSLTPRGLWRTGRQRHRVDRAGVPWLPEDCEEQEDHVTEWTGLEFLDSQRSVKNRKTTSQSGQGWSSLTPRGLWRTGRPRHRVDRAGVPRLPEDCEEQGDNVTEWTWLEFLDSQRTVKNRKTTSQSGQGWSSLTPRGLWRTGRQRHRVDRAGVPWLPEVCEEQGDNVTEWTRLEFLDSQGTVKNRKTTSQSRQGWSSLTPRGLWRTGRQRHRVDKAGVPWLPEVCEEQGDNVTEWTRLEFLDSQGTVKNRKTTSQSRQGWSSLTPRGLWRTGRQRHRVRNSSPVHSVTLSSCSSQTSGSLGTPAMSTLWRCLPVLHSPLGVKELQPCPLGDVVFLFFTVLWESRNSSPVHSVTLSSCSSQSSGSQGTPALSTLWRCLPVLHSPLGVKELQPCPLFDVVFLFFTVLWESRTSSPVHSVTLSSCSSQSPGSQGTPALSTLWRCLPVLHSPLGVKELQPCPLCDVVFLFFTVLWKSRNSSPVHSVTLSSCSSQTSGSLGTPALSTLWRCLLVLHSPLWVKELQPCPLCDVVFLFFTVLWESRNSSPVHSVTLSSCSSLPWESRNSSPVHPVTLSSCSSHSPGSQGTLALSTLWRCLPLLQSSGSLWTPALSTLWRCLPVLHRPLGV